MTIRPFQHSPLAVTFSSFSDVTLWARDVYNTLFRLRQGKVECVTEITLTANAATTTFNDQRLSIQSVVSFDPKTANAAAEKAAGTMYVLTANRGSTSWVITHANNAQADRSFQVSIIG
jgi:hypothetical protein